jgi:HEAT repeat protein
MTIHLATVVLIVGGVAALAARAPEQRTTLQGLKSHNWGTRDAALKALLAMTGNPLADPATQHALVGLLERESNDPQWEGKAEFLGYEDYYESLCGAVQQIAVKYNNAEAWKVLLRSNYDEDSRFAKWIAAQPEAVNYLFALTSDKNEMVRARASFVLAEALARCKPALLDASCVTILDNEKAVLEILRKNAQDSRFPVTRYKAIKALGLCGTEEDLALLDELNRGDTDRWFALTVRQAKQKIESRVKK